MGGGVHTFVRAGMLWLVGSAALADQVVDPAALSQAVQAPDVAAIEAAIAKLAADRRASELALRLGDVARNASLQPVSRAWLLNKGLHELARLKPTAEAQAVVRELSHREPEVYTKVDPDHGDRTTPLYDTGATARFVLRSWQREAAREQAGEDLASARIDAVDRFAVSGDAERAGIVTAYADATLPQLLSQRDTVAAAMARGARVGELALVLARRLADPELASLVIDRADPRVALDAVRTLPQALGPHSALEMLLHARRRGEISSAAMLGIGSLARHDSAARNALFESLEDRELGPSAATALAGLGDPAVSRELGQRLRGSRTDWSQRMYVLALKLDSSPAARDELQRFLEAGGGQVQLNTELRQWLGR